MVSPFVAGKGTYTGLLQGGTYDLSGLAKVTIGATGSFTANFNLGGSIGTVNNSFDVHSHYEGGFTLANNRLFSLSLDLAPGGILTGTVTDLIDAGQVPLGALRAAAKAPKGLAGAYTAAFPLATPDSALPGGTGFGRFTVSATGAVAFTGALGDGTSITVAGQLNSAGAWPFFLPPAKIPQTVLGTLRPNAAAPFSFAGSLQWFRAPKDGDPLYPAGFTAQPLVFTSSRFTAPALVPTLKTQALTSADLTFTGADLALPFDLPLNISRAGKGNAGVLLARASDRALQRQLSRFHAESSRAAALPRRRPPVERHRARALLAPHRRRPALCFCKNCHELDRPPARGSTGAMQCRRRRPVR